MTSGPELAVLFRETQLWDWVLISGLGLWGRGRVEAYSDSTTQSSKFLPLTSVKSNKWVDLGLGFVDAGLCWGRNRPGHK